MRCLPHLLLAACLVAPIADLAAQASPFIVAVVRDDGVMLPVATLDRGRWRTPWPGPAKQADVPVRLEDCPLAWWGLPAAPREWTLHTPGEAPKRLAADRVTWVLTHCQQQVVLHSRLARRDVLRPADGWRVPKYGVAVTGDPVVTLPRVVPVDGTEAAALLDALHPVFNKEERLLLAGDYFAVYTPPVPASTRDRMPVRALSIHAGPGRRGESVYFVELERRYPREEPEHLRWCDEVTYMSGWAHRAADDRLELSLIANDVTSCLLDTVVRAAPHAIVDTPKGPVWLVEEYRPEAEAFGLYLAPDHGGADLLARRFGGTCTGNAQRSAPISGQPDASVP